MHKKWRQRGDAMADESISVVRVRDVLMVTMPADPDDASVSALQMKVLQMMEKYEATGLVLDISAVETLDSFFARTVTETAQMAALMGGRTVVAGMRPSVAITATQLGLTLGRAMSALDVDRALDTLTDAGQRER
jgi:rsbT antagonist protein RsbS